MWRRRLCAAHLFFQAVVLGLLTPVLISVVGLTPGTASAVGLGSAGAALLVAGLLRFEWAYGLGWLLQLVMIGLGVLVTAMYVLGVIFLALWATAYLIGGRIDRERAAAYAALDADPERSA